MLTPETRKVARLALYLAAIFLALAALSFLIHIHADSCNQSDYASNQECPSYSVAYIGFSEIFRFLDLHNWIVMAFATIAIAWFTYSLRNSTNKQGRITQKSIDKAKESSERQLRAYVGVDGMAFEITSTQADYVPIDPSSVGIIYPDFLAIKVRNFGQTPAKNVTLIVGIGRGPHLLRMPDSFDYDAELSKPLTSKNIITRAYLNKDQTEIVKSPVIDAREIWNTKAKKAGTIVFGRIFYIDAFDRNWSTKFCYVWEPWHGPGERFVPYETFNGEDQSKSPH